MWSCGLHKQWNSWVEKSFSNRRVMIFRLRFAWRTSSIQERKNHWLCQLMWTRGIFCRQWGPTTWASGLHFKVKSSADKEKKKKGVCILVIHLLVGLSKKTLNPQNQCLAMLVSLSPIKLQKGNDCERNTEAWTLLLLYVFYLLLFASLWL